MLLHCTDGSTVPVLKVYRIKLFSTAYCFNIEVKYKHFSVFRTHYSTLLNAVCNIINQNAKMYTWRQLSTMLFIGGFFVLLFRPVKP